MTPAVEVLNIVSIIIQIILFIAFIILIVGLNKYIKGLMIKVENLQRDVNTFKVRVEPLIDDSILLVKKLNSISDKVDENIDIVKGTVLKVKDATQKIIDFEQDLQRKIEPPVMETINTFSAIVTGVKTFIDKLKHGKKEHKYAPIATRPDKTDDIAFDTDDKLFENDSILEEYNDINKELNEVRKKLEEMKRV